jgi:large subunit ribosomal protein L10
MTERKVKKVSEAKKKVVKSLVDSIKSNRTTLIASMRGLPSAQYHKIKKDLRKTASVTVAKKNLTLRAFDETKSPALESLKSEIKADIAIFFSDEDPFKLSGILTDNQSPTKAKAGDIAPEDINVEPGPTDLVPGPAISELSGVGLKVAVEGGKLAIKQPHTIVKAGDVIKPNVASVMSKLNINPMKVGFTPIAAYDSKEDKIYIGIKIDKKGTLESLRESITKALSFTINISFPTKDSIKYLIGKAGLQEKAIENLLNKSQQPQGG